MGGQRIRVGKRTAILVLIMALGSGSAAALTIGHDLVGESDRAAPIEMTAVRTAGAGAPTPSPSFGQSPTRGRADRVAAPAAPLDPATAQREARAAASQQDAHSP